MFYQCVVPGILRLEIYDVLQALVKGYRFLRGNVSRLANYGPFARDLKFYGGPAWVRTRDLSNVNRALYH